MRIQTTEFLSNLWLTGRKDRVCYVCKKKFEKGDWVEMVRYKRVKHNSC